AAAPASRHAGPRPALHPGRAQRHPRRRNAVRGEPLRGPRRRPAGECGRAHAVHRPGQAPRRARAQAEIAPLRTARLAASASLVLLIVLCLAWELWLAPLRPGGSWLALKALPLALPLAGIVSGRRYTYQWASMLILIYFAEGVTRAWSERGLSQWLASAEIVLSVVFFAAAVSYARLTRP